MDFVNANAKIRQVIGEAVRRQCLDLDRFLIQYWESHSIRPVVICDVLTGEGQEPRGWLMPEVTRRGILDPVK